MVFRLDPAGMETTSTASSARGFCLVSLGPGDLLTTACRDAAAFCSQCELAVVLIGSSTTKALAPGLLESAECLCFVRIDASMLLRNTTRVPANLGPVQYRTLRSPRPRNGLSALYERRAHTKALSRVNLKTWCNLPALAQSRIHTNPWDVWQKGDC
ncbi:hypothetical protein CCMA1212_002617 [Trichoderma ghanense]|uniref:Deacetylase sirtuin-type domain-containing protein n=1 Tax=Trichoderma ghanense TaxID=65468 RepID=A0ABY2HCF4_9HYPO